MRITVRGYFVEVDFGRKESVKGTRLTASQSYTNWDALPWAAYKPLASKASDLPLASPRPCPLTGESGQETVVFSMPDFQYYTDRNGENRLDYTVVFNKQSGVLYMNPMYTDHGFAVLFDQAGQSNFNYGQLSTPGERMAWIERYVNQPSSLLDVGCGTGQFLRVLPESIQRYGVDINPHVIERAKAETTGIDYIAQPFDQFQLDALPDVITMYHVLEHLPNPLATLQHLRTLAGEHTRLVVEVPVLDWAAQSEAHDIVGFLTVIHLTHFSKATLHAMLLSAGWQIVGAEQIPSSDNGYRVMARPGNATFMTLSDAERHHENALLERYLNRWQSTVDRITQAIERIPQEHRIVVWACGTHTETLRQWTPLFQSGRAYIVVDNDPQKWHGTYHGIPVLSPQQLDTAMWSDPRLPSMLTIVPSSYYSHEAIVQNLRRQGVPDSALCRLYQAEIINALVSSH